MEKKTFYNILVKIVLIGTLTYLLSAFIIPEQINLLWAIWGLVFWIVLLCNVILSFSMAYNAIKLKKWFWAILSFISPLMAIIFYYKILKATLQ